MRKSCFKKERKNELNPEVHKSWFLLWSFYFLNKSKEVFLSVLIRSRNGKSIKVFRPSPLLWEEWFKTITQTTGEMFFSHFSYVLLGKGSKLIFLKCWPLGIRGKERVKGNDQSSYTQVKQGFGSLNPKASGSKKKPLVVAIEKWQKAGGRKGELERKTQNWGYFFSVSEHFGKFQW